VGVRVLHLTLALVWLGCATAAAEPTIRVGSLRYGTLSWQLDVIANHGLDQKQGIRIDALELAGTPAAQLALQARSVDLIVSDWLWVSRQRAEGGDLTFIPFSSAIGSLIVPGASPIRDIAGLAGQRLGIAGSAIDKSWLVLRLYARAKFGLDLDGQVEKSFGAPPLLSEELAAGRLDAVLTFWPFAAKLEAHGMRPLLSIGDALAALGIPTHLPLTGYVVSTHWARENQAALDGFIAKRFDRRTRLGALLDPVADKALLVSVYVTLGLAHQLWTSLVIVVVFRDVMIVGGFLLIQAIAAPKHYDPLYISKINTGLQIALVAFVLARLGLGTASSMVDILLSLAVAATTVLSGLSYFVRWARILARSEQVL